MSLVLVACGTPPEKRLEAARLAAENKELGEYTKYFTRHSGAFLREMIANGTRAKMPYIRDPFTLIPPGDVEEIAIDGNSAILKIKGPKGSDEIRMFMENDEWSIDLFSLTKFWQPLKEAGR
ncbi:MAG: hypothetical protein IT385_16435 [Deltaproteobacteria bacterium]|nr:hypothetical protein [Deltaproteobacteria bacterium]